MKKLNERDHEMAQIVSENISMLCSTRLKKSDKPKTEIANRCGVAPSAVTKWTDGRIVPSVVHLMTIAEYFGVSLEWLVTKHDFSSIDIGRMVKDVVLNVNKTVFDAVVNADTKKE